MKSIVLALLGLLASMALAAAEPVFPPGSRIGLTPPKDMNVSKRFAGFENPSKSTSISLVEMPADAYEQLTAGLTSEVLKKQGLTVTAHEALTLGDKPGLFIAGNEGGNARQRRWVLALADATMTAFIVAQSVGMEGYSEAEMRDALKSVVLRAPLPIEDQMAALTFRLGDRAGFRPVRVIARNSVVLTDGPQVTVKAAEQPIIVLASSFQRPPPAGEIRDKFARSALTSNSTLKDVAVERSQAFRLKGQDWHEIVARAVDPASGEPVVVMQTIRFMPDHFIRMVGVSRAAARDQNLPRFRAVIDGVETE
jgi:hypothetical protein